MTSFQQAKQIIQARFPSGSIKSAFEYKKQFYVFNVDTGTSSYENPYYAVSKITGKLTGITPFEDFNRFFSDADHYPIEV